jgi:hypothetical protein
MQRLTDEVRAELRAKHGAELRVIELEDFDNAAIVIRSPDLKAWGAAFDSLGKPAARMDAFHNLLIDCTVWPAVRELGEIIDSVPALPEVLWPRLAEMAGAPDELQTVQIDRLTGDDRAKLATAGLAETELRELMAAYPKPGQLVAVRLRSAVWLVRRPRARQYYTFRSLSAQGKHFEAVHKLVLGCVVWPSEEAVAAVAERSPGLISGLGEVIVDLGGSGAKYREGGI